MGSYLSDIVAAHRAAAQSDTRPLVSLRRSAGQAEAPRGFAAALVRQAESGLGVIAEVKRRSPSRGDIDPTLDPADAAADYARGGATCLSVLTDRDFFSGSPEDLAAARAASALPVLRKDFTVSAADVYDARIMGADAVLLIVAALSDDELARFSELAGELGLDALVEVHDEAELERALAVDARLVGVNQRDLQTFQVDGHRAEQLGASIPIGVVAVAESGVRDADDAARLAGAGFAAVLVGESLVRAGDRAAAVAALRGHRVADRVAPGAGSRRASG
jgi:indole-3-glycerol phosphate synthase